jgi:hypothetical protein
VYVFLKYFCERDSYDNRQHLQLACGMMIIASIIQYLGIVVGSIVTDQIPGEAVIIYLLINGINVMNYIYFLMMTEIWTEMFSGGTTYLINQPGYGNAGQPYGGYGYPSENQVRQDLHSRPPPGGQGQGPPS